MKILKNPEAGMTDEEYLHLQSRIRDTAERAAGSAKGKHLWLFLGSGSQTFLDEMVKEVEQIIIDMRTK